MDLLKSPELTGQWENKLRQIEKGSLSPQDFREELFQMIRKLTDEVDLDFLFLFGAIYFPTAR